jgi:hypothetical protein
MTSWTGQALRWQTEFPKRRSWFSPACPRAEGDWNRKIASGYPICPKDAMIPWEKSPTWPGGGWDAKPPHASELLIPNSFPFPYVTAELAHRCVEREVEAL